MRPIRSVRARVLIGSIFWTLGLLACAHMLSLFLMRRYAVFRFTFNLHAVVLFGVILMIAGLAVLKSSVSPLEELRRKLILIRDGHARRLDGEYPDEVQPLVSDLNALLDQREHVVHRALAKAGDLAHGLKTPLAILQQESERAAAGGHAEVAAMLAEQVERMRHHVEYHLAHARAAGSGAAIGSRASVAESAVGLARTLRRLNADRAITIDVAVPSEHMVRCERNDLDEMLGNLLDNACKWARSRVAIRSEAIGGHVVITIDDDGPGIDPAARASVLVRGAGLGLPIARDIAELYGGSIALDSSPSGGLRVRLDLPS